jgi:hypothetical protein
MLSLTDLGQQTTAVSFGSRSCMRILAGVFIRGTSKAVGTAEVTLNGSPDEVTA